MIIIATSTITKNDADNEEDEDNEDVLENHLKFR